MDTPSTMRRFNFGPLHAAMQRQIDLGFLPGVATAVLVGGEVVDTFCTGWADKEAGIALRSDNIYRIFSNTGANVAGVLMTQRHMGAMNPYAYEFRDAGVSGGWVALSCVRRC
jgi:beta-lactamase family protein